VPFFSNGHFQGPKNQLELRVWFEGANLGNLFSRDFDAS